jgi:kynurenine formamidase
MADPVSWLLIEPGWRVDSSDGREIGRVLEVTGDSNVDIFDGLAIACSMFDKPRYVPAEQVAEIVERRVRLKLDRAGIERLTELEQPAEQEQIEAAAAPAGTALLTPRSRRSSIPLPRRILLWFGLTGRR